MERLANACLSYFSALFSLLKRIEKIWRGRAEFHIPSTHYQMACLISKRTANPFVLIRTDFLSLGLSRLNVCPCVRERMRQRLILFLLRYDLWWWLDGSNSAVHCFNASQMSHSVCRSRDGGLLHLNSCFALIHEAIGEANAKNTENTRDQNRVMN